MNADTLTAGNLLDGTIAEVERAVRGLVADVPDVWPGRRDEALLHADRVAGHLRDARADLGVLVQVLAQDEKP